MADKRLNPKYVSSRRRKLLDSIHESQSELNILRKRCSHIGTLSYYSEYEDSGYQCSACGADFSRWPADVPKEGA